MLRKELSALDSGELRRLVTRQLRLVAEDDPWASAEERGDAAATAFLTEVMLASYERRSAQADAISEMPLYPTEAVLFDENQVPTAQYTGEQSEASERGVRVRCCCCCSEVLVGPCLCRGRGVVTRRLRGNSAANAGPLHPPPPTTFDPLRLPPPPHTLCRAGEGVLALPKLNLQFLTFHDYLVRNFNLFRLEATYEVREDIADVLKRVGPYLGDDDRVRAHGCMWLGGSTPEGGGGGAFAALARTAWYESSCEQPPAHCFMCSPLLPPSGV